MSTQTVDYRGPVASPEEKLPLRERISFRMIFFIAFIALLVGYPVYLMIEMNMTGGVRQGSGGYTVVDLKAMSTFGFDQVNGTLEDVPAQWRALDGKKIVVHGEMWNERVAGLTVDKFELVYSIAKCCFSGPPQIQHFVHATAVNGAKLGYYQGTVEVKGTLHVNVKKEAGAVTSVYQMDVESVTPVR
jgi:hypothetical protein